MELEGSQQRLDVDILAEPQCGIALSDALSWQKFERVVQDILAAAGYSVGSQKRIGAKYDGGKHKVDTVASIGNRFFLVSAKSQESKGSVEDLLLYEVDALKEQTGPGSMFGKAYLVLSGKGWTPDKLEFYLAQRFRERLSGGAERVHCLWIDKFRAMASEKSL